MNIDELMRNMENARAQLDDIMAHVAALKDEAVPAEVKAKLADIDDEFAPLIAGAQEIYTDAEIAVKTAVAEHGARATSRTATSTMPPPGWATRFFGWRPAW